MTFQNALVIPHSAMNQSKINWSILCPENYGIETVPCTGPKLCEKFLQSQFKFNGIKLGIMGFISWDLFQDSLQGKTVNIVYRTSKSFRDNLQFSVW